MKITQINTTDLLGGAARASFRLFLGLDKIGEDSNFLTFERSSKNPKVTEVKVDNKMINSTLDRRYKAIQKYYINNNRTEVSNTKFTFGYPGYEIYNHPLIQTSEIINLHWVEEFQSTITLHHLFETGKQFVWTLHDERPLTGGYHYSAGCMQHVLFSRECDLLVNDPYELGYRNLLDKAELFQNANITIVSPSKWLAEEARKSFLFRDKEVLVIPNSLETDIFYPLDKKEAKRRMKMNPNSLALLFACENANEKRKGFEKLIEAMKILTKDPEINILIKKRQLELILMGIPNEDIETLDIKYNVTGVINDDNKMREIMSAADIFVLPSLEDNLPNMMLESMACGTCVVGFETGGVIDVVENNTNGLIVEKGNSSALANSIKKLILDYKLRNEFNNKSSELISNNFNLEIQANRYLSLYNKINKKTDNNKSKHFLVSNDVSKINYEVGMNLSENLDKISIMALEALLADQDYALDNLNMVLHKIRSNPLYRVGKKIKSLIKKYGFIFGETKSQIKKKG